MQWRRLHRVRGWGTCPQLLQMAGHGFTVSRRTANKKLTKLHCPSRKRSPKRLIVLLLPTKWRSTTRKKISGASRHTGAPHCYAGPVPPLPLSHFFRRHYIDVHIPLSRLELYRIRNTARLVLDLHCMSTLPFVKSRQWNSALMSVVIITVLL